MSSMVYQHTYGAINIDEHEAEGLYVVWLTSIPYALQGSIEVNGDTITKVTLLCNENIYESCTGKFTMLP